MQSKRNSVAPDPPWPCAIGPLFQGRRLAPGEARPGHAQLPQTRAWPDAIRRAPDAELHPFAARFEQHLADGDAALNGRDDDAAVRARHRVHEIVTLIDDLNGARISTLGRLLQRAIKNGLSTDWAEGNFRRTQRQAVADDADEDAAPVKPAAPMIRYAPTHITRDDRRRNAKLRGCEAST